MIWSLIFCAHTPTAAAEQAVPSLDTLYRKQVQYLQRLVYIVTRQLQAARSNLQSLHTRLQRLRLDRQLDQHQRDLGWQRQQLISSLAQRLQLARHQHQLLSEKLSTLDPESVLKRGYAVVKAEGQIAIDVSQLLPGTELEIQLGKGQVTATVTQTSRNPQ